MTPDQLMVNLEIAIVFLLLFEIVIISVSLAIQVDDVYGWSRIRKISKRRWRKLTRQFMKASKKYFTRKEKPKNEENLNEIMHDMSKY